MLNILSKPIGSSIDAPRIEPPIKLLPEMDPPLILAPAKDPILPPPLLSSRDNCWLFI